MRSNLSSGTVFLPGYLNINYSLGKQISQLAAQTLGDLYTHVIPLLRDWQSR